MERCTLLLQGYKKRKAWCCYYLLFLLLEFYQDTIQRISNNALRRYVAHIPRRSSIVALLRDIEFTRFEMPRTSTNKRLYINIISKRCFPTQGIRIPFHAPIGILSPAKVQQVFELCKSKLYLPHIHRILWGSLYVFGVACVYFLCPIMP